MAPSFLSGLLQTKADGGAIARATGSSQGVSFGSIGGLGQAGPWDIDVAVKHGLEKVIWIFRAVDAIAKAQAGIPIMLRRGIDRRQGEVVDDRVLWRLLNFRANSYETSWQWRYRMSGCLLLSQRGAFIEVVKGTDGRPFELHLLPPGQTYPIPHPKTFVKNYRVFRSDYQIDELEPERVIWVKAMPHPTDPYRQMTPLMAAGIDADTDWLARLFNRNFLANDGRPSTLITVHGGVGGLSQSDADEIKRRFSGGPDNAGRTTVVEAEGLDVADLGATPRDTQWGELLNMSKERLLVAFGVPESVAGNASGRTFDNADAEKENFYTDTVVNHCDPIAAALDPLSGDINDDTVFGYDYSVVDVLQRMQARKREEWRQEFQDGLITIDQYKARCGETPWGVPGTQALMLPNGILLGPTPAIQAELDKMHPVAPLAAGPGGAAPGAPSATARAGAIQGARIGNRHLANAVAARALALTGKAAAAVPEVKSDEPVIEVTVIEDEDGKAHPYLGTRHRMEGMIEGVLTGWDDRQESVITERLKHAAFRKGTRHWEGGQQTKALKPVYAVETDRWALELRGSIEAVVRRAVTKELKRSARDMADRGIIGALRDAGKLAGPGARALDEKVLGADRRAVVIDSIVNDVMGIVDQAARNQSNRLADKIALLDESGASMRAIEAEIRKMIGARSPWRKTLATNVTTTAIEAAKLAVYSNAGTVIEKVWRTVDDERVRPTHRIADGQERKIDQPFSVGAARLQFPGQTSPHLEEVVGCRCWADYVVNHDELAKLAAG